jgi:hypothetical protein
VPQLLELNVTDGGSVLIEVDEDRPLTRGGRAEGAVIQAQASLEQVLGQLGPTLRGVVTQIRDAVDRPDEIEIEMAVKISTDANVIIARAGGEANFRIAMRWCHGGR